MQTTAITTTTSESAYAAPLRRAAQACDRRFPWVVGLLLIAAACARTALLREYLAENPFAEFPTLDGELYWNRAGELAAGDWVGDTPFHIAPLYTYLLGALRSAGGGLSALYGIQVAIHLATAALVALATRERFGSVAGCIACAIFLGLAEPALFTTRVLGTTLQIALVAWLWLDWARLANEAEPSRGHIARVGALLGAFALAFPAALLLVPVYAVWLLVRRGDHTVDFARAAIGAAGALALIGTATVHNAVVAGEFIPITSHAGITLAAGNGPGSVGIFTPLTETRNNVKDQAHESALAFEQATGHSGSWQEIDRFYRNRVIRWWISNPVDAAALFARKSWWFLTSRHYDNVTAFALEREHGLLRAARFAPIETPWILGLALLGAAIALPRARRFTPELALSLLPFAVCLAFMYSARYRAVALPVICGLAGFAITYWRSAPRPRTALAAAIGLPAVVLAINGAIGFGALDFMRADFASLLSDSHMKVARARSDADDVAAAEAAYHRADAVEPADTKALLELAALQLADDRPMDARSTALAAIQRDRADEYAHRLLYDAQILSGDYRNAEITLNLIEPLDRSDAGVQVALAWFYAACPDPGRRNGTRSRLHAGAAERILGGDDPSAVMARALAEAADGAFDAAIVTSKRGAALALARDDGELHASFEQLRAHLLDHKIIAARPQLLTQSGD